jgi:hypothetical protein
MLAETNNTTVRAGPSPANANVHGMPSSGDVMPMISRAALPPATKLSRPAPASDFGSAFFV